MPDLLPGYDRWKLAAPESDPYACVVCGDAGFDAACDDAPILTDDGEVVCSYKCDAVDRAKHASGTEATMRAIIYAMDEGAELRVRGKRSGGPHVTEGDVIDWARDDQRIIVRSIHRDVECELRVGNLRMLEVM